jgi:hypothetical protein
VLPAPAEVVVELVVALGVLVELDVALEVLVELGVAVGVLESLVHVGTVSGPAGISPLLTQPI